MSGWAAWLVVASATIPLVFGLMHLRFTFHGSKLTPRDDELRIRMQEVSPVITRQTTMWKVWVGMNVSHSYGLILFAGVYIYLALAHGELLFSSYFLLALGAAVLLGYIFIAKRYFFRAPLRGLLFSTSLYALALVVRWA
jgi:hypothetical protein